MNELQNRTNFRCSFEEVILRTYLPYLLEIFIMEFQFLILLSTSAKERATTNNFLEIIIIIEEANYVILVWCHNSAQLAHNFIIISN